MITVDKIKIHQKYKGDFDGFSRVGDYKEKALFKEKDWSLIDSTLQDSGMIKKGLCSKDYIERYEKLLHDNFDNKAIELIHKTV